MLVAGGGMGMVKQARIPAATLQLICMMAACNRVVQLRYIGSWRVQKCMMLLNQRMVRSRYVPVVALALAGDRYCL